jgi:hypothetical protein
MAHQEHEGCIVEQLTAGDRRLRDGSVRDGTAPGSRLSDVTPGLDPMERVRAAALRAVVWTRAISRDLAAVIDKGVAAASEEARAAWQRWSPPSEAAPPPPSEAAPPPPSEAAPPPGALPSGAPPSEGAPPSSDSPAR